MIIVRRLNGVEFALNCDHIETIEANPDTTIRMTNKNYYIVQETQQEVIDLIIDYKRRCNDVVGKLAHNAHARHVDRNQPRVELRALDDTENEE